MKLITSKKNKSTICFNADLSRSKATDKIGSSTFLTLPKNASTKLPLLDSVIVEGVINSVPFRATLDVDSKGGRYLRVSKAMQDVIGVDVGDMVTVEITRVADESETRVPIDLSQALKAIPSAEVSWADITPMARRDWIFSITTAKQLETRKRRIEKACDMLSSGKRRLCCFPGIKSTMKGNEKSCGMWSSLS